MSVHGSSWADAELAEVIEDVIARVCTNAAMYAADLVQHAGALLGTAPSGISSLSYLRTWGCACACIAVGDGARRESNGRLAEHSVLQIERLHNEMRNATRQV
jgi:hypothetical protein